MRPAPCLVAILLAAVLLAPFAAGPAGAQTIAVSLDGPPAMAPSQVAQYNVTILGAPAAAVDYTVTHWISGSSTTGGSPLQNTPGRITGNRTAFQVNVTAPQAEQTLTLHVQVSGKTPQGEDLNATAEAPIVVIRAIVLTATFHNGSTTAALNVTVRVYVDDALVGRTKIARIGPNADATVSHNYLPVGLQAGSHSVRLEADLNGNGVIEPSLGEIQVSDLFYEGVTPPSAGWSLLLGIAISIPVFLGVVAFRRRRQR